MKCSHCKNEIIDESKSILVNIDGDFVCNEQCKIDYEKERDEFFNNISDDKWYEKNYFKLDIKSEESKKIDLDPGIIYVPYIFQEKTDDSSKDYEKFMMEYNLKHRCCPKCGSTKHTTTLMDYILDMYKKDEYKDLNNCKCLDCGDIHTTHDRVK